MTNARCAKKHAEWVAVLTVARVARIGIRSNRGFSSHRPDRASHSRMSEKGHPLRLILVVLTSLLPSARSLQLRASFPRHDDCRAMVVGSFKIGATVDSHTVGVIRSAALADTMLALIDKWAIEDEISTPYPDDVTADACMVPIELDWLNAKVCELDECPLDLPEAFESVWEQVQYKGEGCVTVNALKEQISTWLDVDLSN